MSDQQKIYQTIGVIADVMNNRNGGNMARPQKDSWLDLLDRCMEGSPSGSGFDNGTRFDLEESSDGKRLVFETGFHHMDEHGCYDGWTHHRVILYPEFSGYRVRITGRDRNFIKEFIEESFRLWLDSPAPEYRYIPQEEPK